MPSGVCGQRRPRSACAFRQSDLIILHNKMYQWRDFAWWSESAHVAHARMNFFAWRDLHILMSRLFFRDEITLAVLKLTEDGTLQVMKKTWWDKGECGYDTGYRVGYEKSRDTVFHTWLHVRPAKTQISLCIRAVWSESLQGTLCVPKDPKRLETDMEDSKQPDWSLHWMHMQSYRKCCAPAQNIISKHHICLNI